jgi:uncharacterized delta-60 repeat protein
MPKSIIFVDSRVANYQSLIDSFTEPAEVFILDGASDGLGQMATALQGQTGIDAIHVISHGSQGALYLGSTALDSGNLAAYGSQLGNIGSALTQTGDILLYGCNVAQGDVGLQFINSLAQYTGADVAASRDGSGAALLGGNWVLEEVTGSIEALALLGNGLTGLLSTGTGKVTTDLGTHNDFGYSVTVQADGKILVAGSSSPGGGITYDFALVRYNPDGSLDTSFDSDGKVTTDFGVSDYGKSVTLQADGKILVAGNTMNYGSAPDTFSLARYNSDGSLDTSFDGDGKVTTDFGPALNTGLAGQSIAMQGDGKILVAGYSQGTFKLVRYNTDGSLDPSFDGDGKVNTAFGFGFYSYAQFVNLQTDGKILVTGWGYPTSITNSFFLLARYNPDGSLDTSFDTDGMAWTGMSPSYGFSSTLQTDGKILVAGGSPGSVALARFNPNGSMDASFGIGGSGTVNTVVNSGFSTSFEYSYSVTVQADGKILVAGSGSGIDFILVRYNADGSLDTSFDGDGKVMTDFGAYDFGDSLTVQADGKILVAGYSAATIDQSASYRYGAVDFALARYNVNGSLDVNFGVTPILETQPPTVTSFSPLDEATCIAIGSNIVVTFNEPIAKGTGNIVLKTAAGTTVANYNAATSANLSISGNTLTINPTADLAYSTGYKVEFTAGTIKDLAGNSYAGTTSYNFTTNGIPVATSAAVSAIEDAAKTGTLTGTDPEGSTLTFAKVADPSHGTLTVNASTGAYVYTPASNYNGADSFTFKVNDGTADSAASTVNITVSAVNDLPTGSVIITGTATPGQILTATNTLADVDGLGAISYKWQAAGVDILGATASIYTLTPGEVGKVITVIANYTDAMGTAESKTSVPISVVGSNETMNTAPTFAAGDGKVTTDISGVDTYASAIVQTDGKILLAGFSVNFNGVDPFVATSGWDFALARFNTNGTLDTSFAGGGKLIEANGYGGEFGTNIAVQANGTILVVGSGRANIGSSFDFALIRFIADGGLDTSFSGDGKLTTDIGSASIDSGNSVVVQADGKILVAGHTDDGVTPTTGEMAHVDFALVRYNADGGLDYTFSPTENPFTASPTYFEGSILGVVLDNIVEIVDTELSAANSYNGTTLTLSRHIGASIQDVFSALSGGTLATLTTSSYFAVDGITIGRVTANSAGTLTLAFNANATQSLVNKAMQQIAYANTSDAPPATVQIDWTFNDGNTGVQGDGGALSVTGSTTVQITPTNDYPILAVPLADQKGAPNVPFSFTVPAGSFTDPDLEALTYSVGMSNGTGVPPWLSFNASTRTFSGTPGLNDIGLLDLQVTAKDSANASVSDIFRMTVATASVNQILTGTGASESFTSGPGNDTIDGGAGIDTAVYSSVRAGFALAKTSTGFTLIDNTDAQGTDTLQNVERLKFSDGGIALDVGATQPGGQTILLLGAVLGMSLLGTKLPLIGAVIDLFDQGYTLQQLSGAVMRLPIWDVLTGQPTPTNTDIAIYLLTRVNGFAPDATTLATAVTSLSTEIDFASQGNFLWHLAESSANQTQVNLVGLATTGAPYGW